VSTVSVPRATNEVRITVPFEPPSVNHYKKVNYRGGRMNWFLTKEATAFMDALYLLSRNMQLHAETYEVEFCVYQGKGERGDVDNYSKCVLDGLVKAGVITTDSAVTDLYISKRRDAANPRTEIVVRESGR
jgi:Holliday junction resolvase RusA-like endonuclease